MESKAEKVMREALERIAASNLDVPEMQCQERSDGSLCGRAARFVSEMEGMGHVVVCERHADYYRNKKEIVLPRDANVLVGNLRNQAQNALAAARAEEE